MLYNIGFISAIHEHELAISVHMSSEPPPAPHPFPPLWAVTEASSEFPALRSKCPLAIDFPYGSACISIYSLHSSHPLLPPLPPPVCISLFSLSASPSLKTLISQTGASTWPPRRQEDDTVLEKGREGQSREWEWQLSKGRAGAVGICLLIESKLEQRGLLSKRGNSSSDRTPGYHSLGITYSSNPLPWEWWHGILCHLSSW